MRTRAELGLWLVLTLVAAGYSTTACSPKPVDPLITSGQSLHMAADTFVATARLMDAALDAHVVTPEQYRAWGAFARKFQESYPLAVAAWNAAVRVADVASRDNAAALIESLVVELSRFYVSASLAVRQSLDGGAP